MFGSGKLPLWVEMADGFLHALTTGTWFVVRITALLLLLFKVKAAFCDMGTLDCNDPTKNWPCCDMIRGFGTTVVCVVDLLKVWNDELFCDKMHGFIVCITACDFRGSEFISGGCGRLNPRLLFCVLFICNVEGWVTSTWQLVITGFCINCGCCTWCCCCWCCTWCCCCCNCCCCLICSPILFLFGEMWILLLLLLLTDLDDTKMLPMGTIVVPWDVVLVNENFEAVNCCGFLIMFAPTTVEVEEGTGKEGGSKGERAEAVAGSLFVLTEMDLCEFVVAEWFTGGKLFCVLGGSFTSFAPVGAELFAWTSAPVSGLGVVSFASFLLFITVFFGCSVWLFVTVTTLALLTVDNGCSTWLVSLSFLLTSPAVEVDALTAVLTSFSSVLRLLLVLSLSVLTWISAIKQKHLNKSTQHGCLETAYLLVQVAAKGCPSFCTNRRETKFGLCSCTCSRCCRPIRQDESSHGPCRLRRLLQDRYWTGAFDRLPPVSCLAWRGFHEAPEEAFWKQSLVQIQHSSGLTCKTNCTKQRLFESGAELQSTFSARDVHRLDGLLANQLTQKCHYCYHSRPILTAIVGRHS